MRRNSKEDEHRPFVKDISIVITIFVMKLIGLWLANNKEEQRQRNLTFIYTVVAIMFGMWVETRDFYYSWPDINNCSYVACNILCMTLVLIKLFILCMYRRELFFLLQYMYTNFWHSNYDPNEKLILSDCSKICTFCIVYINIVAHCSIISYILTPIMENIGKNASERILPFNMWLDWPLLSISPYYEIFFVAQVLSLYHIALCYVSFDNLLCLMNLHTSTQLRILQYRLMNLGNTNTLHGDEKTICDNSSPGYLHRYSEAFKSCVRQHQEYVKYCGKLEHVFTLTILGHVLIYNLLICLVGYQIFLADTTLTRRCTFTFHLLGTLGLLLLFAYSCDALMETSMNIGTAVYSGPWTNLPVNRSGIKLRKDLRMIIIRSRKPFCLSAGGFFPISLTTFTTVLSTAMSYFTLLRQSIVN